MWLFIFYLALCAAWDSFCLKIPNWLTIGVFPFLVFYRFMIDSWTGVIDALLVTFVVVAILFLPFTMRGIGAADVKFLVNIGIFVGFANLVNCFLLGALCSVPLVLFHVFKHRERVMYFIKNRQIQKGEPIKFPYSPPFAIGAIIYLLQ